MKLLYQIAIITGICFVGTYISDVLPFPFPSSIAGMVLLFILLAAKIIKIEQIEDFSGFLVKYLAFFLVPNGVELMNHYHLLGKNIVAFVVVCAVSLIATFSAAGFTVRFVMKLTDKKNTV